MMKSSSAIADTNVLLSAIIRPDSTAGQALRQLGREAELLISSATSQELLSVLQRPKFDVYVPSEERLLAAKAYIDGARLVHITSTVLDCRDPKDNKFLELALSGKANLILTGDADLLTLHPWRSIAIISPASYLSQAS